MRVFHYDRTMGKYVFGDYRALIRLRRSGSAEKGGMSFVCGGGVRLLTSEPICAVPGDYVSLGREDKPDRSRDFIITEIRDNRLGSVPHWRLIIGGGLG